VRDAAQSWRDGNRGALRDGGPETDSPRGYVLLWKGEWRAPWLDRFARFCQRLAHIRTFEQPKAEQPKAEEPKNKKPKNKEPK
jgi:hypothetical protein